VARYGNRWCSFLGGFASAAGAGASGPVIVNILLYICSGIQGIAHGIRRHNIVGIVLSKRQILFRLFTNRLRSLGAVCGGPARRCVQIWPSVLIVITLPLGCLWFVIHLGGPWWRRLGPVSNLYMIVSASGDCPFGALLCRFRARLLGC